MQISDLLVQGLGFMGLAFMFSSYQFRSNIMLFLFQALGNVCFAVQFMLLGSTGGCISCIVIVVRNCLLYKIDDWDWVKWKGWIVVFSAVNLVLTILTWNNFFSIFAYIATVASTIGFWSNNARTIRMCNLLCGSPAWLIHNIGIHSIGGAISESLSMCSMLLSIYRFGWKALGGAGFDKSNIDKDNKDKE